jgi:hypothetical protein
VQQARALLSKEASFATADEVTQHRLTMAVLASAGFQPSEQHVTRRALETARMQLSLAERRGSSTAPKALPNAVDVSGYPGRNDLEKTLAACRATIPGADRLPYDELFELACSAKNAGRFVNLSTAREAAR